MNHVYYVIGNDPSDGVAEVSRDMCNHLSEGYEIISAVTADGMIHYVLKYEVQYTYNPNRT